MPRKALDQEMQVLQEAMQAFDRSDSKAAREVEEEWQFVELRFERVGQDLTVLMTRSDAPIAAVQGGLSLLQDATHLFWLAQLFKQFADHARRICRRVV